MSQVREIARAALGEHDAWVVGGAVRDRLMNRATGDLDLVVAGSPEEAARAIRRAAPRGTAVFALSDAFGAWRVVGPDHGWQVDVSGLRGGDLETDLRARDVTVNAIAEPVGGGGPIDPTGGIADLAARRLRAASTAAFEDDPLRTLRVARFAAELNLEVEPATAALARAAARGLSRVSAERIFYELKRVVTSPRPRAGLELMEALDVTPYVLPELLELRGVEQNRYHNADVHDHTLAVLDATVELQEAPGAILGAEHDAAVRALLAEPLADELTRGGALRFGALLHDVAKPQTRRTTPAGDTLGFPGHDILGDRASRAILRRLRASEKLQAHVGALALHHLGLGFLVHERPLTRRSLFRYLKTAEPVEVDVTLLSVADRLATRGHRAGEATAAHLELAREVVGHALAWRAAGGAPRPLVRGDELARELGMRPGPQLGRILAELSEAQYAGDVRDRQEAVAAARALAGSEG